MEQYGWNSSCVNKCLSPENLFFYLNIHEEYSKQSEEGSMYNVNKAFTREDSRQRTNSIIGRCTVLYCIVINAAYGNVKWKLPANVL